MNKKDKQNVNIAKKIIAHEEWEASSNYKHPSKEWDKKDKAIIKDAKEVIKHEKEEINERHLRGKERHEYLVRKHSDK